MATSETALTAHLVVSDDNKDTDPVLRVATETLHDDFEISRHSADRNAIARTVGPIGDRRMPGVDFTETSAIDEYTGI